MFPGGNFPLINTNGNYWFVSSISGSNGNDGKSIATPFATLAYAAAYPGVIAGDVIIVLSNHTETVSSNAGIIIPANVDVCGQGSQNGRPIFTFSTSANASILFSGINSTFDNIEGVTTLASTLIAPLNVTANDITISNFDWQDTVGYEAIHIISANNVDDLKIDNVRNQGLANGTIRVSDVLLNNTSEVEINLDSWGNNSIAAVEMISHASRNVRVTGSVYVNGVSNSAQIVRDYITSAPSTWTAYVFDGYAGTYVSGGSATGNGTQGTLIATGSGTAVSSNVNNILANVQYVNATTIAVNTTVGTINTTVTSINTTITTVNTSVANISVNLERTFNTSANNTSLNATGNSVLFTVSGGPILMLDLLTVCVNTGTGSSSTLAYGVVPTSGASNTVIASTTTAVTSIANGTTFNLPATFGTGNVIVTVGGCAASLVPASGIIVPQGNIVATVGVAAIAGVFQHLIRYKPLSNASAISTTV